jgi:chaperone modulatory protein CbpM
MATRYYSETEVVARVDGLTVARLRSFVSAQCLSPEERGGRLAFAEADVARARLLAELAEDFDLDEEAAGLVITLIDQIHGLRHRLRGLGDALAGEPEEVRARIRARLTMR